MSDDDNFMVRRVAEAGHDLIEVLKAQNLNAEQALAALGSVIIGILKSEDDHDVAMRYAIKLCFIVMLEIDPKGMFQKAEETAQTYPGAARFLAQLRNMKEQSR